MQDGCRHEKAKIMGIYVRIPIVDDRGRQDVEDLKIVRFSAERRMTPMKGARGVEKTVVPIGDYAEFTHARSRRKSRTISARPKSFA